VSTRSPGLRRATAFVVASLVAVPLTIVAVAPLPTGARPAGFVVGMGIVAALALLGGIGARGALLADSPERLRAGVLAWVGLTLGVTAGVFCVWSAIGLLS
jgi:hypothetical protein